MLDGEFMIQINYQYKGLKAIPTKWFNGVPIEHRYESCWYDGSEKVNPSDVKQRVKDLNEIVDDDGKKKYRTIVVLN